MFFVKQSRKFQKNCKLWITEVAVVEIEVEDGEEEEDMEADVVDVEVSVEITTEVVLTMLLWVPEGTEVIWAF